MAREAALDPRTSAPDRRHPEALGHRDARRERLEVAPADLFAARELDACEAAAEEQRAQLLRPMAAQLRLADTLQVARLRREDVAVALGQRLDRELVVEDRSEEHT